MYTYSIVLERDPGTAIFTVTVPALPGCVTQGHTRDECLSRAQEAIAAHIGGLKADGLPVPLENEVPEILKVTVAA